jgi:DNA-binding NarL/FixJ family response regulator
VRSCLIADDHPLIRTAMRMLFEQRWPGVEVVEAEDFPTFWSHALARTFDLVLVDLVMPGGSALDEVERFAELARSSRIVALTGTTDDALLTSLVTGAVHGFLYKSEPPAVIVAAVELVLAGGRHFPPRLAELASLGRALATSEGSAEARAATPTLRLTERQTEIVSLIASGRTNKEIARLIGVSPATVKTHVSQALAAIGAVNRADAVRRASELKLI